MFEWDPALKSTAKIKVIGIGGAGGNAVNTMISYQLRGVDFIVANTDAQALGASPSPIKLQLGTEVAKGLGAGSNPEVGRKAALESREQIREQLEGSDMIFIAAGLGGGTGTGGAPIAAEIAKELGALTVAVVTKPFQLEGKQRNAQAESGITELRRSGVDTLIIVPNQRLLGVGGRHITFIDAFKKVDDILYQAVKGISDLIMVPGLINLDFADVKTIMSGMGVALMGTGSDSGENRAVEAARRAISSPLLEDNTMQGARGVLLNITGGPDMTLGEIDEAASVIQAEAHPDANIIFGTVVDDTMGDEIRVTVIATGFDDPAQAAQGFDPIWIKHRNNLKAPTFIRQGKSLDDEALIKSATTIRQEKPADGEILIKSATLDEEEGEDLEIPTFMRRLAD
ncbi:MAG: cell division protein FtsZ [Syntrophaceae bacterium]|nr:cell division protein FtsZ [Syntrophaceae bacterium]